MKNNLKKLSVSLALVMSLAACSTPNSTTDTQNNTNSSQQLTMSSAASQQASADLTSYSQDEATFIDTELLASQETSFSTKALTDLIEKIKDKAEVKTTTEISTTTTATTSSKGGVRGDLKAQLESSGAITTNADGKVVVDTTKLRATVKEFVAENKAEIKAKIDKVKDKLKEKREVAKEKADKLKTKSKVSTSNVVEVTNADGSVTKTMSVEFKSDNMTRENTITKTTLDGKMLSMTHTLNVTAKAFTKTSSRITTFNTDGSKKVVTESVTTYTDGRKREVYETRDINASGSGTGTGTITFTDKNGQTTVKNLETKITLEGTTPKVDAVVKDGSVEVKLSENASGTATLAVTENNKAVESLQLNVETKVEAEASAS